MQKKRLSIILASVMIGCLCVTGCGKKADLKNNNTIIKYDDGKITADTLYETLRDKYGINVLVDMLDHKILDKKYKEDDEEKKSIDNQVKQMKMQYNNDEDTFKSAIKQYLGVEDEKELRKILSLEYRRNLAVEDHIKDSIKDDEIQKYYDEEMMGDIKVRHILIKPDTTYDMPEDEKEVKEKEAKQKAEDLIKQLDEGANFEELAKEHSDDTGTKDDGGLIDYFNKDSNMDESFLQASIDLKKNEYTKEPVKSVYGYHIILKLDQKKKKSLKKVKDEILDTLTEQRLKDDPSLRYETLIAIREEAGVKFKDDSLKKDYDKMMDELIEKASGN